MQHCISLMQFFGALNSKKKKVMQFCIRADAGVHHLFFSLILFLLKGQNFKKK
jgi:hypothetical protein